MICGSGGSKSRLARAGCGASWGEMKTCTLLWREAHFQVKMLKTLGLWTTFGTWDIEKVDSVVARSKFPSQHVQNTPGSDHFWQLRCRKSARRCGAKHISKSKCTKHTTFGPLLAVEMSKKCTPLWREEVKMYKALHVRATFGGSDVVSRGRRKGLCTLSKVTKTWGFCSISKNDGMHGAFEEDLQRCMSRGRRSTKDMFMRDVRRSGRWFPERGWILEYQMCRFAKMILRGRRSTSYDLTSLFRGWCSTLDRWTGKIAKRIGTSLSALHSTFHFWRTSRRILRFWCLALPKMRKSRRIASFRMLSSSKNEDVSQTCSVLDVLMFKHDGSLAEFLCCWFCR